MNSVELIQSRPASDGAGVKINRISRMSDAAMMDPFLMVDEIHSEDADDYIEGFPSHPHRGFETITVMLAGKMRHRDHLGNNGVIEAGGGQWMTTGRGVIHSEIPEQDEGLLHGFQVWLNLPAEEKMQRASYQDLAAESWVEANIDGVQVRGIGGVLSVNEEPFTAPVIRPKTQASVYTLKAKQAVQVQVAHPENQKFLLYVYEGEAQINQRAAKRGQMLLVEGLSDFDLKLGKNAGVLLLSGKPLNEPVVQYGPFVMNTMDQVNQAVIDYRNDELV
ncbi:pirin family protein [Litoribacillus peritrichatus]|uniref:Pirin family protein n=1 Tax=Litoribacillus peritrichatus TaxID=718191 RepID=A0ABP7N765_9GAMM